MSSVLDRVCASPPRAKHLGNLRCLTRLIPQPGRLGRHLPGAQPGRNRRIGRLTRWCRREPVVFAWAGAFRFTSRDCPNSVSPAHWLPAFTVPHCTSHRPISPPGLFPGVPQSECGRRNPACFDSGAHSNSVLHTGSFTRSQPRWMQGPHGVVQSADYLLAGEVSVSYTICRPCIFGLEIT